MNLRARLGGQRGSMFAKVGNTPALGVQLDLLLQPKYIQSYTRQNKGDKFESDELQEVSKFKAILPPD